MGKEEEVQMISRQVKFVLILLIIFFLVGCTNQSTDQQISLSTPKPSINNNDNQGGTMNQKETSLKPPAMEIDINKSHKAVLSTDKGLITIQLYAKKTPITVNNFVYLARQGFYNNTIFHRTIKNFMIQGGDPKGNGTGGPGYRFNDEAFTGEYLRGIVAMANAGPNTNGSQFFIMHKDYSLPKNYVIFGQVIEGLEVVDQIAEAPVEQSPNGENSKPVNPVVVKSVEILEE